MTTERTPAALPHEAEDLDRVLAAAEARFAGIVEISADAIISLDHNQRIILFNEGAERIFGWTAGEVLGQPLDILLPPRFRAVHQRHVESFGHARERARRMGERTAIAGLRKDGTEFPAEASISRYELGAQPVFNVVLRDVTDRARTAERQRLIAAAAELMATGLDLGETLRRAARLVVPTLGSACAIDVFAIENAPPTACSHALPQREQEFADACRARPLDAAASPALGEAILARVPILRRASDLPDGGVLRRLIETASGVKGTGSAVVTALTARGRGLGVMVITRSSNEFDPETLDTIGDLARLVALAIDNARLYEASLQAVRARDRTVAVVSHDLRNPVNAIRMIVGNLLASYRGQADPALLEYVQVIQQAARQADRLIQDLLDVARIEAGRLNVMPEDQSIVAVVGDALEVLMPLAQERGVGLAADLPAEGMDAFIDADRVHQVISNVVGNALTYTPRGGTVRVAAVPEADAIRIVVRDTGVGIPPAALPHIFDRFWQGHEGSRGSGLGLTIARGIVEAHGGRIGVESTPGEGTTVTIVFPRAGAVPPRD